MNVGQELTLADQLQTYRWYKTYVEVQEVVLDVLHCVVDQETGTNALLSRHSNDLFVFAPETKAINAKKMF